MAQCQTVSALQLKDKAVKIRVQFRIDPCLSQSRQDKSGKSRVSKEPKKRKEFSLLHESSKYLVAKRENRFLIWGTSNNLATLSRFKTYHHNRLF